MRTRFVRCAMIVAALATGLAWAAPGQADQLANYNKDLNISYVSPTQNNRALTTPGTVGDYDGHADNDDYRVQVVFSDTLTMSPASNYTGPAFYGGVQYTLYDYATSSRRDITGNRLNDKDVTGDYSLWYYDWQSPNSEQDIDGCWYFKLPSNATGWTFDETSSIKASRHDGWSAGITGRWIVREGTQFWASEVNFAGLNGRAPGNPSAPSTTLAFANDYDHGNWAPYDPAVDLEFDESQTFVNKTFQNVTAAGILFDTTITAIRTGAFGAQFNTFQVEGVAMPVPEPATLALLSIGGIGALIRRRRKA